MLEAKQSNNKKPDTQTKILDAACEEFAEFGLAGARVDRLAKKAGVNKAMIYYHFGSKEKLYQAIIDQHFERMYQISIMADYGSSDFETIIANLARNIHLLFDGREKFIPIFLREIASGGEYFTKGMVKVMNESGYVKRLLNLIDEGKNTGVLRDINTKQAIASYLGMNILYQLTAPVFNAVWEVNNEDEFRKKRPETVADLFLNGIKAK